LKNTAISSLVNIDMKSLTDSLKGAVGEAGGAAAEGTVKKVLNKLLPFGK